jgi:hypothetical protein
MKPEFQRVYESIPADEPRSRLAPYGELIMRWRRQGRTYHRIRELLAQQFNVQVSYGVLYRFVKYRSKPRKPEAEPEVEQVSTFTRQPELAEQPATCMAQSGRPSLQSFRNKPALEPKPAVLVEFHYDEDKPLTIDRTIKD